jgi:UDP-3-O-[3-hydroxymyristoyl] glucosamine N-acyltransferase
MKLSAIAPRAGADVIRDAEFANLGFLFDDLPGTLLFVEAPRFVAAAKRVVGAACILCTPELVSAFPDTEGLAVASAPKAAFFEIQKRLVEETEFYGAPFASVIDPSAAIHPRAWIAPRNVRIGPGTIVGANAVVGEGTTLGSNVRVQPGVVLGAEGFQPARREGGLVQMAHAGGLRVEDSVEIFANAVIARAVFRQTTRIGEHSRIGNGAFVSHNAQIGKRCFVGHNAVVNGNTEVGDDVWIGPNATIANLLEIGDRCRISLGAVVIQSLAADAHVTGMTALEHRRMLRHVLSIQ